MAEFSLATSADNGQAVVHVIGEVDVSTGGQFGEELLRVIDDGAREVVVDLSETSFFDSTGCAVLVRAFKRLGEDGGRLTIRSPRPHVRKVLEITGLDQAFGVD